MSVEIKPYFDGGDPKRAAQKTCEWLSSDEGKKSLQDVLKRGTPFSDRLKDARKIDTDSIRKPMGF
ncbi:hypothetical protein JW926_04850 [Candidatus Sumerlaeota bacterium]|nr:hypothetical protein [Candidatus Sumerlaeota bacterium]